MSINVVSRLLTVNRQYVTSISNVDNHITINARNTKSLHLIYDPQPLDHDQLDQVKCRVTYKAEGQLYLLSVDSAAKVAVVIRGNLYVLEKPYDIRDFLRENTSMIADKGGLIITNIIANDVFNIGFFWIYDELKSPSPSIQLYGKTLAAVIQESGTSVVFDDYRDLNIYDVENPDLLWFTSSGMVVHLDFINQKANEITSAFYSISDSDINISLENMDWVYPNNEDGIWTAPKYIGMVDHILDTAKHVLSTTQPTSFTRISAPRANAYGQYELGTYGHYGAVIFDNKAETSRVISAIGTNDAVLFAGAGFEAIYSSAYPTMLFVRATKLVESKPSLDITSLKVKPLTTESREEIEDEHREAMSWNAGNEPMQVDDAEKLRRANETVAIRQKLEQKPNDGDTSFSDIDTQEDIFKDIYTAEAPAVQSASRHTDVVVNYPPLQCSQIDTDSIVVSMIPNLNEPSFLLNLPGIYANVVWRRVSKEVPLTNVPLGTMITYANTTFIRMNEQLTLVCDMHINLVGAGTPSLKEVIHSMLDADKSAADIMLEVATILK